jgi:hypothetical protein
MRAFYKILPCENTRRINKLIHFRNLVATYYKNCEYNLGLIENQKASQIRIEINKELVEIHDMVIAARLVPVLQWIPPPAVGGYVQNVDLILNVFHLNDYQIDEKNVLDYVERAIGVYETNKRSSKVRLFNPFYYLGIIIDLIANSPFVLLGKMGFNREKAEASVLGRLLKVLFYLITVLGSILSSLHYLGYLDNAIEKLIKLLKNP